jgi:hypothetical protein
VKPYVHIEEDDHEGEHASGLPAPLPEGERMLWQGSPVWSSLAINAFHVRKVAIYFGVLLAIRFAWELSEGKGAVEAARYAIWIWPLALAAVAILALLAYAYARTTLYTITTRRVLIRSGVAMTITVNLPYKRIDGAGLHVFKDGTGDLPLKPNAEDRVPILALWPNMRPWRWSKPEPMLRSVPDASRVADILAAAIVGAPVPPRAADSKAQPATATAQPATAPAALKPAH